jgi:hypothetical protein
VLLARIPVGLGDFKFKLFISLQELTLKTQKLCLPTSQDYSTYGVNKFYSDSFAPLSLVQ